MLSVKELELLFPIIYTFVFFFVFFVLIILVLKIKYKMGNIFFLKPFAKVLVNSFLITILFYLIYRLAVYT